MESYDDKNICQQIKTMLGKREAVLDKNDGLWETAVLVPLVKYRGKICVLFEVRSKKLAWQPGDVCFPGGKRDKKDKTLRNTAIRETCEELGILSVDVEIYGELDYLVTQLGPILYPFLGIIHDFKNVKPNLDEVGEVFLVPLDVLLEQTPRKVHMQLANKAAKDFPYDLLPEYPKEWNTRRGYDVYFYQYKKYVIWGMTARILYAFLERLRNEIK